MKRVHQRAIVIVLSLLLISSASALDPGQPRTWGNATYYVMNVGESIPYMGKQVTLISLNHNYCTVQVGNTQKELIVAQRHLPTVMDGIRVFISDNRNVPAISGWGSAHTALNGKDAVVCVSDASKPLLDFDKFAFPVSTADGWEWSNEENSHQWAWLGSKRSHEGMDIDLMGGRGKNKHALVGVEDGWVRWVSKNLGGSGNEGCICIESGSAPGVYYIYKHVYDETISVSTGQSVTKGQHLAYIWGDDYWGHLHFGVPGWGSQPAYSNRYRYEMNVFPQMWELWNRKMDPAGKVWTRSDSYEYVDGVKQYKATWTFYCYTFLPNSTKDGNRPRRDGYSDVSGMGWILGKWCTPYQVETVNIYGDGNVRLRKTLHQGLAAESTNPNDFYDFEVQVENSNYDVKAQVGDRDASSWQQVLFEGVDAGTFSQEAGAFVWTPKKTVSVQDGKLTIRIVLRDSSTLAGLRELFFSKID